jgi:hypothetical protein
MTLDTCKQNCISINSPRAILIIPTNSGTFQIEDIYDLILITVKGRRKVIPVPKHHTTRHIENIIAKLHVF